MPELPEVETIKHGLAPLVEGQEIVRVVVRQYRLRWPVPRKLSAILSDQIIQKLERRGKYLLFYFSHGCLLVHLGMSGVLTVVSQTTQLKKHDHVDIYFENGSCLRLNDPRRFGCVLWITGDPLQHKLLVNLGVEPLSKNFNAKYLFVRTRKRNVAIKQLLMNNKIVVGIGNIYVAEILFKAKIHPKMCASKLTLTQCTAVTRAAKTILRQAIKLGGTTFRDYRNSKGKPGYFQQKLFVYGRHNELCKVCGSKLQSIVLGQRSVVFCSECQKM
ncbi:MAG: bifunctional DNA-formamidopyrimidine glycosylase/DNA-(apurinic or apyrimidinic site) lyase [Gammaproteobacteria bacterium]|jgi:formamidopyrimidine-DNA glycosylase